MPRTIHDLYSACFCEPLDRLKKELPHHPPEDVLEIWQALSTRPHLTDQTQVMIDHIVKTGLFSLPIHRQSFLKYLLMMSHEYKRTSDVDAFMDAVMSSPPATPLLSVFVEEFLEHARTHTPNRLKAPLVYHLFKHPLMFKEGSPLLLNFTTHAILFGPSKFAAQTRTHFFEQLQPKHLVEVVGWLNQLSKRKWVKSGFSIDQWINHCMSKSNAWWCEVARLEDATLKTENVAQKFPHWSSFMEKFHIMNALHVENPPPTSSLHRKI